MVNVFLLYIPFVVPEAGMQCVAKIDERFRTSLSNDPINTTKYVRAEIVSSIGKGGLLELFFVDLGGERSAHIVTETLKINRLIATNS